MTARPSTAAVRRARMVDRLRAQGIADARVLEAMSAVPREAFVPLALRGRAYEDERLPIGEGQTMSLPGPWPGCAS